MKQFGFILMGMGMVASLAQFFSLNLNGVGWEILFMLGGVFASLWIPESKAILNLKLHWRIAIIIAILCTFFTAWTFFFAVLPAQNYALAVTFFTFGCLAFLFHHLDNRAKSS